MLLKKQWSCAKLIGEGGVGLKNRIIGRTQIKSNNTIMIKKNLRTNTMIENRRKIVFGI